MRKVLISFVSRDAKRKQGWNFLFQLDKGNERLTRMNFYSSYPDYRVEIGIESDRIRSKLYAIRDLRDFNPILLRARFINSPLLLYYVISSSSSTFVEQDYYTASENRVNIISYEEYSSNETIISGKTMFIFQTPIRIWTTGSIPFTRPSPPSTNDWPSSVRGRKSRRIVSRDRNGVARGMGTGGEGTSANTRHLRRGCRRNAPASRRTVSFIRDWSRTITITCIDTPALAGTEDRPMCTRM